MDKSNYQNNIPLVSLEEGVDKMKIILNESQPVKNFLVPDSYYAGNANFEEVYKMLMMRVLSSQIKYPKDYFSPENV
jgi:protein-tyrosine phosphatase